MKQITICWSIYINNNELCVIIMGGKQNTESDYVSKMRYIASYFNARRESLVV